MKFRVRDRHSLLVGETRLVNASGYTIHLVVPDEEMAEPCRVENRPFPRKEEDQDAPRTTR